MSFAPNSRIDLYSGLPIDNSYENTLYFSNVSAQSSYFSLLPSIAVLNNNYRVEPTRDSIKVSLPYSRLYHCNYMRFRNESHENKWFYAFITKVEYVNEETTKISYEIDVLQTWLVGVDYELEECFIEREHTSNDTIGYNLVNEDIPEGETVTNGSVEVISLNAELKPYYYYIVAIASNDDAGVQIFDRLYTPSKLYAYTKNDVTEMAEFISSFSDAPEKVLSVYICPSRFVGLVDPTTHLIRTQSSGIYLSLNGINPSTTIDGYAPRNKKLLTYPYNYLKVVAPDTACLVLRYELFKVNTEPGYYTLVDPNFMLTGNITQPVQMVLRPCIYKNSINPEFMQEKLSIVNFPTCAWSTDAFREYLTNNLSKKMVPSLMAVTGDTAGGVAKGTLLGFPELGLITGGFSLLGIAGKLAVDTAVAAHHDVRVSGVSESSSADFAAGNYNFYGYRMSVRRDRARQIDNYFQMFGYASNEIKTPAIHVRSKWTYTKTIGCSIASSRMPVEHMRKVESIFNTGIRFWSDYSTIGNYNQDNPIIA